MHMIRHDADGEEFVTRIVKMTPCVQDNGSSLRTKGTPMRRLLLSRRKSPTAFRNAGADDASNERPMLIQIREKFAMANAIASTLQACAPRIFIPRKQRQGTAFFLPCCCS